MRIWGGADGLEMEEQGVDGDEPGCSGRRGGAIQRPELEVEPCGDEPRSSPNPSRGGRKRATNQLSRGRWSRSGGAGGWCRWTGWVGGWWSRAVVGRGRWEQLRARPWTRDGGGGSGRGAGDADDSTTECGERQRRGSCKGTDRATATTMRRWGTKQLMWENRGKDRKTEPGDGTDWCGGWAGYRIIISAQGTI
jgi:hypothetical protein